MGKLSNDEIKFILNLEAKGLQTEIGKSTAAIKKFAQENKSLQAEVNLANKFLEKTEKQMKAIERSGKTNTTAYYELKQTYNSTKNEVADYNKRIAENNSLINKNNEVIDRSLKQLRIEDMTMSQLKNRAKDLQKQLDSTAFAADPEEYKKLQKELTQVDNRMGQLKNTGKGMMSQLSSIPGPAGQVVQSLMGMGKAMMALVANPVGAVIAAIVLIFMAFKKAINSSEEATFKLNQILAPLTKFLTFLLKILQDLVIGFLNFAEAALSGMSNLLEKLPFVGQKMKEINETARDAIKLEREKQELQRREREWLVGRAQLENEVAKNRDKAYQREAFSVEDRLKFLDQALEAERRISEEAVRQAKEKLRIAKIEAARAKNTSEVEQNLRQLEAVVIQSETEMYTRTRGIQRQRNTFIKEEKRNAIEAAKEAIQKQKDALETQLNNLETNYNQRVSIVKKNGILMGKTDNQINLQIAQQDKKFFQDRINANKEYLKKVKDEKLKSEIKKKISNDELAIIEAQKSSDNIKLGIIKDGLDKNLKLLDNAYSVQKLTFDNALADRKITQEQYDTLMLQLDEHTADSRVLIVQGYKDDIIGLELETGALKEQAVIDANALVISAETDAADKRKAIYGTIVNSTLDFKQQFGLLTYDEEIALQTKILEDVYKAKKEFLEKEGADTTALTAAYEQAKTNIALNSEQDRFNLRKSLNISNWAEEFEMQKLQLDQLHKAGMLSEEEYQAALKNMKMEQAKAYFDYYLGLGKNAVSAFMDAEISTMEATYDEKIAAAGDNNEEVERLEKEKAQKKLDIEKKYADVNFAIKVAEIIANTAVAIMQGFAQLGPIGGAIAAVLMGATGVAQVISANAERRKVKAMTLDNAGSSSPPQQRVVTGKEEGGYVNVVREQDKKRFWAKKSNKSKGFFKEPSLLVSEGGTEFVASAQAVSNKSIKPFLDLINNAQEGGYVEQLNMDAILSAVKPSGRGYESGGYVQPQPTAPVIPNFGNNIDSDLLTEFIALLQYLKRNGVKAKVVLSDLQEQTELQESSNSLASKS
ncbi:hypothetical protein SDC9_20217 [bioreactor metagenome]|uniref:Uncharacterized protein n=1 Tax=bioreactor metagenome TaxID=1076179 RepID=A0A644U654_9ZZZZ